jgi:hypothetical protein
VAKNINKTAHHTANVAAPAVSPLVADVVVAVRETQVGAIIADVVFGYVSQRTSFYLSAAFGIVGAAVTWLFLPDTTGMSLDELDRWAGDCNTSGNNNLLLNPKPNWLTKPLAILTLGLALLRYSARKNVAKDCGRQRHIVLLTQAPHFELTLNWITCIMLAFVAPLAQQAVFSYPLQPPPPPCHSGWRSTC